MLAKLYIVYHGLVMAKDLGYTELVVILILLFASIFLMAPLRGTMFMWSFFIT